MGLTARRINPGYVAKRGKLRRVAKQPASKKRLEYKSVKYARGEPMEVPTICQGSKPQAPEWKDPAGEGGHAAH